jgi:NAD(P)-dependent dehydrogenase (short-subunit alcohol dehydrogenase family)
MTDTAPYAGPPAAAPGALVTGAGHRIGAAIAHALAADGWRVAVHYNNSATAAEATVAAIVAAGGTAAAVRADLADPAALPALVMEARAAVGPLGCLVNNAALFAPDAGRLASVNHITAATFDAHMAVNLRAPVLLAQEFAARLDPAAPRGVVVNLLDQKLANMNPDFASYTLSKAGLQAATLLLAQALAPRVRVVGVAPGLTLPWDARAAADRRERSFETVHGDTPLGRGSTAQDIAGAVRYLVGADAVTGTVLVVDGGQHLRPSAADVMFEPEDE